MFSGTNVCDTPFSMVLPGNIHSLAITPPRHPPKRCVYSHISLESLGDWVGQPDRRNSWEPAPGNTDSAPSLEDAPSEEDAAALAARLQQTYGNGLSRMDGICTTREQTRQLNEIPHWTSDRGSAQVNRGDYRYDKEADTAGDCRERGFLYMGCAGCGYKAVGHLNDGTAAGGTDYTPCDRRHHFGREQTNRTAVTGFDSGGTRWDRPSGTNCVKSGGTFCVVHADGDRTPSPLPSPPAPQMSTTRRHCRGVLKTRMERARLYNQQ